MHYLYLYCTNIDYHPDDLNQFINNCRDYELLGDDDSTNGEGHYLLGDKFPLHICFLGCSPYLKLFPESEGDKDYCSAFISYSEQPGFTYANSLKPPVCPHCDKAIEMDLQTLAENTDYQLTCNHCRESVLFKDLNWRKDAGFYNFAIRISNIFPKEAVPADGLMQWLQLQTGSAWKYFYV